MQGFCFCFLFFPDVNLFFTFCVVYVCWFKQILLREIRHKWHTYDAFFYVCYIHTVSMSVIIITLCLHSLWVLQPRWCPTDKHCTNVIWYSRLHIVSLVQSHQSHKRYNYIRWWHCHCAPYHAVDDDFLKWVRNILIFNNALKADVKRTLADLKKIMTIFFSFKNVTKLALLALFS